MAGCTCKPIGQSCWDLVELSDATSDYRVYYALASNVMVLLLCGGDKSSQDADIERAIGH